MSEDAGEFPHTFASSEQSRAYGPNRRLKRKRCFLVAQADAIAQKQYFLRSARKSLEVGDQLFRKSLIVEASVGLPSEIRLRSR
jgi:hypothetical protein